MRLIKDTDSAYVFLEDVDSLDASTTSSTMHELRPLVDVRSYGGHQI